MASEISERLQRLRVETDGRRLPLRCLGSDRSDGRRVTCGGFPGPLT